MERNNDNTIRGQDEVVATEHSRQIVEAAETLAADSSLNIKRNKLRNLFGWMQKVGFPVAGLGIMGIIGIASNTEPQQMDSTQINELLIAAWTMIGGTVTAFVGRYFGPEVFDLEYA